MKRFYFICCPLCGNNYRPKVLTIDTTVAPKATQPAEYLLVAYCKDLLLSLIKFNIYLYRN